MNGTPPVRQMIREAVDVLGSPTTNVAVKQWVEAKYPGTNPSTVQCHLIMCCVNQPSRVYYPDGGGPRTCNDPRYDFLYRPQRGVLEWYDPARHGVWMIERDGDGQLVIRREGGEPIYPEPKAAPQALVHRQSRRSDCAAPVPGLGVADGEVESIEPPTIVLAWSEWRPLTQKGNGTPPGAPERPGVYQIRCSVNGSAPEIVYIGLSSRGVKGLRGRIENHRSKPGQCADNLVNAQRFWDLAREPIEIRWAVTEDSHYAEAVLLRRFKSENGRLPRFNTNG